MGAQAQSPTQRLQGRRIGVIGLGLMGEPMAVNLQAAGAQVWAFTRSPAVLQRVAVQGLEVADSAGELVRQVDEVILMLPDTPTVEHMLLGPEGILPQLQARHTLIDMGTSDAGQTRDWAARVRAQGAEYVDAPVSGGQIGAQTASLSIMAGGREALRARIQPLFDVLGQRTTWVGEAGAGQVAKAANQVMVGLTIAAVSEGMALAARAGVAPAVLREALLGGFADSTILKVHGERMASGNFTPGAKANTQLKDLRQALALAAANGQSLPVTELVTERYAALCAEAGDRLDQSALYTLYQQGEAL